VQGSASSLRRGRQRRRPVARPPITASRNRVSVTPMIALGTWALGNPLSAVTALGLLVYGFLRYVYARFYSPLGVKPEEVGLGYAEILSQSVVGLLLFSAVMFLLLFIGAIAVISGSLVLFRGVAEVAPEIRRDWRFGLLYLVGMAAPIVLVVLGEAVGWGVALVGWVAFLFVIGLVGTIRSRHSRSSVPREESKSNQPVTSDGRQPAPAVRKPPVKGVGRIRSLFARIAWVRRRIRSLFAGRWWRRSIIMVFLLTMAVVVLTLVGDAQRGAARVQRGEAWRSTFGGAPFTSMEARPATVVWASSTPPSGLELGDDHCLLYLGQSNGITVFYDAGAQRSIRLPSGNVIVSVRNEEPACASRE
jgi:hypothetical protein